MRIALLGPVAAFDADGESLALGGPKQRAVIAMLALQPRGVVSTDALSDGLWGDRLPPHPRRTLSVYVSTLSKALDDSVDRSAGVRRIVRVAPGYRLDVADTDVDTARFQTAAADAEEALRRGRPLHARSRLGEAFAEWRGPPLHDLIDFPFWAASADQLEQERLKAEELCLRADLDLGRHHDVIADLSRAVEVTPLRERLWEYLMLALYRDGRQAEALETFQRARTTLRREAGLDPNPELVDLERRILAQDDTLRIRPPQQQIAALPQALTSLVGRETDRWHVLDVLKTHRLVTLVGPGGVGKTRLAQDVGQYMDTDDADSREGVEAGHRRSVTYAECATVRTAEALGARIEGAIGWNPVQDGSAWTSQVRTDDDEAPGLLILDNLEQVATQAQVVLPTLLQWSPRLAVLCTSRVRLGCPGEQVVEVTPLSTEASDEHGTQRPADDGGEPEPSPAARLYLDRAKETYPGWRVDPRDRREVEALCTALAGLPLAIELAASQARTLTPGQALPRIHTLLAPGDPAGRPGPAAALRASLQHSLELVSPAAARVFSRLSVFAGGFTLEAAEAVCRPQPSTNAAEDATGQNEDVVSWLFELVDASLVQVAEGPVGRRFTILEPLRLSAGAETSPALAAAHAEFHARLGERAAARLMGSTDTDIVHQELDSDASNWVNAVEWAQAHDPETALRLLGGWRSWWVTTPEASTSTMQALDRLVGESAAALSAEQLARAQVLRATAHYMQGQITETLTIFEEWLPQLVDSTVDDLHLMAHCWWAAALSSAHRNADADRAASQALALAEASGSARSLATALDLASYVKVWSGQPAEARELAERSVALLQTLGDDAGRCFSLDRLATALFELDRGEELRACAQEMLRLVRMGGVPDVLRLNALWNLACAHLLGGDAPAAAGLVLETLPRWAEAGMIGDLVEQSWLAAAVLVEGGDTDGAARLVPSIEEFASAAGTPVASESIPTPIRLRVAGVRASACLEPPASPRPRVNDAAGLIRTAVPLLERLSAQPAARVARGDRTGPRSPVMSVSGADRSAG